MLSMFVTDASMYCSVKLSYQTFWLQVNKLVTSETFHLVNCLEKVSLLPL